MGFPDEKQSLLPRISRRSTTVRCLRFYAAGLVLALVSGTFSFDWFDLLPDASFGKTPEWARKLRAISAFILWVTVLIVLLVRVVMGRRIKAGSYLLGAATPIFYLFAKLLANRILYPERWDH
ncbi:MAG: hypothetical protein ACI8TQ_002324 [Planctomycetota bacterium]|jgi:hypothetical protein